MCPGIRSPPLCASWSIKNGVVSLRAGMDGFVCIAAFLLASLSLGATDLNAANTAPSPFPHFADGDDSELVAKGQEIYASSCSSCHGRRLQGQALWQLKDQYAGRRA